MLFYSFNSPTIFREGKEIQIAEDIPDISQVHNQVSIFLDLKLEDLDDLQILENQQTIGRPSDNLTKFLEGLGELNNI